LVTATTSTAVHVPHRDLELSFPVLTEHGNVLLGKHTMMKDRQREIWTMIAESHTTKEIASMLFIAVKTVEHHRKKLYKTLGIYDTAGLTRAAIRIGLINA